MLYYPFIFHTFIFWMMKIFLYDSEIKIATADPTVSHEGDIIENAEEDRTGDMEKINEHPII